MSSIAITIHCSKEPPFFAPQTLVCGKVGLGYRKFFFALEFLVLSDRDNKHTHTHSHARAHTHTLLHTHSHTQSLSIYFRKRRRKRSFASRRRGINFIIILQATFSQLYSSYLILSLFSLQAKITYIYLLLSCLILPSINFFLYVTNTPA